LAAYNKCCHCTRLVIDQHFLASNWLFKGTAIQTYPSHHVNTTLIVLSIFKLLTLVSPGHAALEIQRPPTFINGIATSSPPQVISRPVLLAKHPVAHRGDVRVVQAVDPSERVGCSGHKLTSGQHLLDNYVNVVVFSQRGTRPLPNMLSGSDLVSRTYIVCACLCRAMVIWRK
jgi:hypothetical protein